MLELELRDHLKTINDSNAFLINLTYLLANEFKSCAWGYFPSKDGPENIITLGKLDLGIENSLIKVIVKVEYIKKGIINKIIIQLFKDSDLPITNFEDIEQKFITDQNIEFRIKKSINKVINYSEMKEFTVKKYFESVCPFGYIKRDKYTILNIKDNLNVIEIKGKALSGEALEDLLQIKVKKIFDLIAVDTNSFIIQKFGENINIKDLDDPKITANVRLKNFLEGYSVYNNEIILSEKAILLIDALLDQKTTIINDKNTLEISKFLDGCNHINRALKYGANIDNVYSYLQVRSAIPGLEVNLSLFGIDPELECIEIYNKEELNNVSEIFEDEVEISFYLSGIEVISDLSSDVKVCNSCGQKVYSIKKRVLETVSKYTDNPKLEKLFGDSYDLRSSFLHSGKQTFKNTFNKIIPQLDSGSQTGTSLHLKGLPRGNIKEYSCYILREHLISILSKS